MREPEGQAAWERGGAEIYTINFEALSTREVTINCKTCKGQGMSFNDGIGCEDCLDPKHKLPTGKQIRKDYGFVHRFMKGRRKLPVDTLIIDELSILKDPYGKRAATLRAHRHKFKQVLGLTGTPMRIEMRSGDNPFDKREA